MIIHKKTRNIYYWETKRWHQCAVFD